MYAENRGGVESNRTVVGVRVLVNSVVSYVIDAALDCIIVFPMPRFSRFEKKRKR